MMKNCVVLVVVVVVVVCGVSTVLCRLGGEAGRLYDRSTAIHPPLRCTHHATYAYTACAVLGLGGCVICAP